MFSGEIPSSAISSFAESLGTFNVLEKDRISQITLNAVAPNSGVRPGIWNGSVTGNTIRGSANSSIAIIDSGIDASHSDIGSYINVSSEGWSAVNSSTKIVGWKDWVDSSSTPFDPHGHGSHVSGIAAGRGTEETIATQSYTSYIHYPSLCTTKWFNVTNASGDIIASMNATYYITPGGNMSLSIIDSDANILASQTETVNNYTTFNVSYTSTQNGTYGVSVCDNNSEDQYDFALSYSYPVTSLTDGFGMFTGIAPDTKLVGARVCNLAGCPDSYIISAMDSAP